MTNPGFNNGNFLGGIHGGYWPTIAQAQGYSAQAANLSNLGTSGALFTQQAAVARPPIEDAGIRAGEIIAYRCWTIKHSLLHSMAANFAWIPGEVVTGDPIKAGLGVHAFKTLGDAVGQYGPWASKDSPVVFGTVSLWGDVIEHEKGYRAEFGAIDSIVMAMLGQTSYSRWKFWNKPRDLLAEVRRTYGLTIENRGTA